MLFLEILSSNFKTFRRGAVGAVIVYDVTRRFTFENAHGWLTELREQTNDEGVFMLIGNKVSFSSVNCMI